MSNTNIVIVGHFRVHAEDATTFAEILRPHVAETNAQRHGCTYYHFAVDVADPALFRNMECWTDQQSLDAHLASTEFAATLGEVMQRVRILEQATQLYEVASQRPLSLGG
jgi:quinol monooxygenase YgiN